MVTAYSLYVDVWAPASATPESKFPVKVWVFGGSNEGGGVSDPTYNGCFSAVDSIVVSINYRVGPLGFLASEDLGLSGNYGLMDQLLGVRWVHDNVAAFGGDPVSLYSPPTDIPILVIYKVLGLMSGIEFRKKSYSSDSLRVLKIRSSSLHCLK